MHTTWDRFVDAREINDLFIEGGEYVDRLFATLKDKGIRVERNYLVKEAGSEYVIPLSVFFRNRRIDIIEEQLPDSDQKLDDLIDDILRQMSRTDVN